MGDVMNYWGYNTRQNQNNLYWDLVSWKCPLLIKNNLVIAKDDGYEITFIDTNETLAEFIESADNFWKNALTQLDSFDLKPDFEESSLNDLPPETGTTPPETLPPEMPW